MDSSDFFLGVDGGQSSTKALIGDASGLILGRGTAGPCNHVSAAEARDRFLATLGECVSAARTHAGLGAQVRFRAACFGMSGGPDDKEALLKQVVEADRWLVTHDGTIALAGALGGNDGIVTIAGTGSLAFGRNGSKTLRAGGWGYIYGDEGSAFWIAKEAVRAALRSEEGWGTTTLHALLLEATGSKNEHDALHLLYTPAWPRSRVARLAIGVDRAAEEGDEIATVILGKAGDELAMLVGRLRERLFGPAKDPKVQASFIGGVFRSKPVLSRFIDTLKKGWNVDVRPPIWGADAGALIEAYRLAGVTANLREG